MRRTMLITGIIITVAVILIIILGTIALTSDRATLLAKGTIAPDFSGRTDTGDSIKLSDYRGRNNVVLFFYPKDFTAGCTAQVCSFRDNYAELLKHDATLLGVSFDSEASHRSFAEQYHLPFSLLSDTDKSIGRLYGVADRLGGLLGGAKRVTYVIDKRGVIQSVLHHEIMIGKHLDGVLESLRQIEKGTDTHRS